MTNKKQYPLGGPNEQNNPVNSNMPNTNLFMDDIENMGKILDGMPSENELDGTGDFNENSLQGGSSNFMGLDLGNLPNSEFTPDNGGESYDNGGESYDNGVTKMNKMDKLPPQTLDSNIDKTIGELSQEEKEQGLFYEDEGMNDTSNDLPYINPGGSSLESRAYMLGRGIGAKPGTKGKGMSIVGGVGSLGLGLARTGLSGYANQKRKDYVMDDYEEEQKRGRRNYTTASTARNNNYMNGQMYQYGGEHKVYPTIYQNGGEKYYTEEGYIPKTQEQGEDAVGVPLPNSPDIQSGYEGVYNLNMNDGVNSEWSEDLLRQELENEDISQGRRARLEAMLGNFENENTFQQGGQQRSQQKLEEMILNIAQKLIEKIGNPKKIFQFLKQKDMPEKTVKMIMNVVMRMVEGNEEGKRNRKASVEEQAGRRKAPPKQGGGRKKVSI